MYAVAAIPIAYSLLPIALMSPRQISICRNDQDKCAKKLPITGSFLWCAGHGMILAGESPATGIYRQV